MSIGVDAAEHRATCRVSLCVEYSAPDVLPEGAEAYPGPISKPGHRAMRRLNWYSGLLALASKAPVTPADVHELGHEIGVAVTQEMFRTPLVTMLLPLVETL
jgi:hypothetical protein